MSYRLILDVNGNFNLCGGIDDLKEAIEFSVRSDMSNESCWIPLRLNYFNSWPLHRPSSTAVVRGYEIPVQFGRDATSSVTICGDVLLTNEIQFRWIGTSNLITRQFRSDMWALASVNVVLVTQNERVTLIQDTFGGDTLK